MYYKDKVDEQDKRFKREF